MLVGLELFLAGVSVASAIGKACDDSVASIVMDGEVELGAGIIERDDLAEGTAARVLTVACLVRLARVVRYRRVAVGRSAGGGVRGV